MKASKKTKRALIPSVLAVILCVAMLIGTTFAWFTDTASTSVNKIQAGKLDVTLYYKDVEAEGEPWKDAEGKTLSFLRSDDSGNLKQDDTILWEPGCTYKLPELKIVNKGNLALKYKIEITGIDGDAKLNKAIKWTMEVKESEAATAMAQTLTADHSLAANAVNYLTISGTMDTTAGNEYQGLSISGIAITVLATQDTAEYDSEDDQYDKDAKYSQLNTPVNSDAEGDLNVTTGENNTITVTGDSAQVVYDKTDAEDSVMYVSYPSGVVLKTNTSVSGDETKKATVSQSLEYKGASESTKLAENSDVTIDTATQAVAQYELTLPVAESNKTLVAVTINYTAGLTGVQPYHNGTALTKHTGEGTPTGNKTGTTGGTEYYTYDSTTGALTLYLYSASPIDIVYDRAGTVEVTNEAEFVAAVQNPEVNTVVLGDDITIAATNYNVKKRLNVATNGLTIDLGDCTLTVPNYTLILNGDNITLRNGKMTATTTSSDQSSGSYAVVPWGKNILIDDVEMLGGVNVTGDNSESKEWPDATVTIKNCKIAGTNYYAVCAQRNAAVTVTNSELTFGKNAFFWAEKTGYSEGGSDKANVDASIKYENVTFSGTGNLYNAVGVAPIRINEDGTKTTWAHDEYTLKKALADSSISEIVLNSNITLTERINVNFTGTIDLGGKTITAASDKDDNGSVFNIQSGNVTIKNGTLKGNKTQTADDAKGPSYKNECDVITVSNGAKATLVDGLNINVNSITGACVYAFDGAEVTITGGRYENRATGTGGDNEKSMTLNQANVSTQLIKVSGGTFVGQNPATGDNHSGAATTFLAGDYVSTGSGDINGVGTWTVTKSS